MNNPNDPQNATTTDEPAAVDPGTRSASEHDETPARHDPPQDQQSGDRADPASLRREAAQRRRQLREVEAERDTLRARLDDHDRRDVERLAADVLADPRDVWISSSLDQMRAGDGTLDRERVTAELKRVADEKPHWRKPSPPMPDFHAGARRPAPEPPSFGAAAKQSIGRRR